MGGWRRNWRGGGVRMPITVEYRAFAIGAVLVAAIMIWDRIRMWKRAWRIETQLRKMEKKIYILEMQESGRLMRLVKELSGKSRAKIVSGDTAEMACHDVAVTEEAPSARACTSANSRRRNNRLILSKSVPELNAIDRHSSADHDSSRQENPSDREGR
jgi:hypothetical protein